MRSGTTKKTAGLTAIIAILAATGTVAATYDASAQERVSRRPWTLFDIFRPAEPRRPAVERSQRYPAAPRVNRSKSSAKKATAAKSRKSRPALASPVEPEAAIVEKAPDAKKILVIGDFLGGGMAEGLVANFAIEANFVVLDRTNGSSGFVRQDVYEWSKELPAVLEAEKPAAVVVMMGSNDRQPMRLADESQPVGSDLWNKEYETRVRALGDVLETAKIPYLWVGMPSFKSPKMTSDMLAFNDVYKAAAQANKGEFVDIWDGFTDETGAFVATGPDVNGQPAKLRGSDGINLTKAGKAKVAFYVDKPLRKMLGIGGPAAIAPLEPGELKPGETPALDRTPPMSLHDPAMDGGTELLGARPASATPTASNPALPSTNTRQPALVAPPAAGRADDYSWIRREQEKLPPANVETTTAISR